MKNRTIFLVFFVYLHSISSQENLGFLPASQRLLPSYDSLYDKAYKQDMQTIITAKQALLVFMDSLESLFCEEFTYIPHVKFELPESIPYEKEIISGSYRGKEKTIYFNPLHYGKYIQGLPEGISNEYLQGKFDTVAIHELGHWYHDVLIGRLTGQYLGTPDKLSVLDKIEYEVIVEGIALWIVYKYSQGSEEDKQIGYFPISDPLSWRYYGFDLVKPILDRKLNS